MEFNNYTLSSGFSNISQSVLLIRFSIQYYTLLTPGFKNVSWVIGSEVDGTKYKRRRTIRRTGESFAETPCRGGLGRTWSLESYASWRVPDKHEIIKKNDKYIINKSDQHPFGQPESRPGQCCGVKVVTGPCLEGWLFSPEILQ